MVHESMKNLRLDRRLSDRRGWIPPEELQAELEKLPDVSAKAEVVTDDEGPAGGQEAHEAPAPASELG